MIQNLVGGLFGKIVDNAEGILDKVITTDKERDENNKTCENDGLFYLKQFL